MSGNKKAQKFKERQMGGANNILADQQNSLDSLRKLVYGISMNSFNQERELKVLKAQMAVLLNKARNSDFRSVATMELLSENGGPSKEMTLGRIADLHIKEFVEASAMDDKDNKLDIVDGLETAAAGLHAILTANLFKDGVEVIDERILRSKIELGKNELFAGLDDAMTGMNVGDTRQATLETEVGPRVVEVTLLGLRKPQPEAAPEAPIAPADLTPVPAEDSNQASAPVQ